MEVLLKSFGDDAPSGENLEYEPVFAALLLAAQPGEERQAGDEIIAAEEPEDREIIERALAVLEQSHDLRAAVYMAGAELRSNGFEGFAKVSGYIRGCLEQYWDSCHPKLDEEDDNDPTMRVNTVLGIADAETMIKALRRAPMTRSQSFGLVSLRDIAVADGDAAPHEGAGNILDQAGVMAAFKDTDPVVLGAIYTAAAQALEDIRAIDAVFDAQIPGLGPDLGPLIKTLQRVVARLADETGVETNETVADAKAADKVIGGKAKAGVPSGAITSPQDVQNAIDRIMAYYVAYEPSSPVPLILSRAKRLVGADFMTIVTDMAADGLHNVKLVGGIKDEE